MSEYEQRLAAWNRYHPGEGDLPAGYYGEGGSAGNVSMGSGTVESYIEAQQRLINEFMDEFEKRSAEFESAEGPFQFDEILANASIGERYDPYYEAELGDFTGGITRQRESVADERNLLSELTGMSLMREDRSTAEAIKSSEEGYAGKGLFFSGQRARETGLREIESQERKDITQKQTGVQQRGFGRELEGLSAQEQTFGRRLGEEKTVKYGNELENLRQEALTRRGEEKLQYLGPSLQARGSTLGLGDLLQEYAFRT